MYDCVIVGGGVHGTYCCQRLLEDTALEREDLLLVDPHDRLLASFRRKAAACGMDELRSTFVQHVGTEPFGLESFAESRGRESELRPTPGYPPRPTLSLFLDFADYVIERKGLADRHRQVAVESIRRSAAGDGSLVLETDAGDEGGTGIENGNGDSSGGQIRTRTCVLAIGHGGRYRYPPWADGVDAITHAWDGFDPERRAEETVVVGGGITAVQLAIALAERERVTLCPRDDIAEATIEADPRWINWNHIEKHLHRHPPGSRARSETVREARNDGTVPPRLLERLERAVDGGDLAVRTGDVRSAREIDDRVRLLLENGGCCSAERAVLATGFAPVFEHPFVDRVAASLDLERGHRGMPVLDDETLAWRDATGSETPLFVTGALAAGTVGPLAGNVAGARRAADRIARAIEARRPTVPA
ncbi:FAD/NAD(P)-binding protein [Haloterrigena sp. SYSU A558-1]|uniref:FAD/NAD(P)-binding protein n=1 Tax=Haloterrigena gelatinilytica TaxID=2741724 RepID=A0ABX2LJY1_9EURY|nr:FAD/NAD(P)-binding protein [Haloterrigena gelatinilytica]NUC73394.1 FAD/NAD(P)-binding protein [Haloterrigena gelatinilytica]